MESPWTFWKSRKLKKKIYILLPSYCNIAQIQVTVIFKMTFIPNLRSLSSFSSSLQFRVRIRVEAQPSLLKRATIFFLIFFIFSFYLDFVFILSWRVTSWNKKIISLQFSYLCFYQSHSYTTMLWTLFIPLCGCHDYNVPPTKMSPHILLGFRTHFLWQVYETFHKLN